MERVVQPQPVFNLEDEIQARLHIPLPYDIEEPLK